MKGIGSPVRSTASRSLGSDRLHGQHSPSLLRQLSPGLRVRVEECKVADDDRDREGDGQDPGQGAQRSDEHSNVRLRGHVAIANRRHGNDGPPEANGYRREVVVRVVLDTLSVEDQRGEDDDAEYEEEDEQTELVCARLEGVYEDLETGGVARQFEQPHDPDDAEELEYVVLLL